MRNNVNFVILITNKLLAFNSVHLKLLIIWLPIDYQCVII